MLWKGEVDGMVDEAGICRGEWKLGESENFPGHAPFNVLFVGDRDGILVGGGCLREG